MHLSLTELLLDLVNNAVEANPDQIEVEWAEDGKTVRIGVTDDGDGMSGDVVRSATDPFFSGDDRHPGRSVGLGIPFLIQTAESTGGTWWLESESGRGTSVGLELPADHVDLPPAGRIPECFATLLGSTGGSGLTIARTAGDRRYTVSRDEMIDAVGEIDTVLGLRLIQAYVQSQEEFVWSE